MGWRSIKRVNTNDISSQFVDSMLWNINLGARDNKVLINNSISVEHTWSIDIKDDYTDLESMDNACSFNTWESKVNGLPYYWMRWLLYPNIFFNFRLDINSLKERFNFQARRSKISLNWISYLKLVIPIGARVLDRDRT